jgi:hypothetical protein
MNLGFMQFVLVPNFGGQIKSTIEEHLSEVAGLMVHSLTDRLLLIFMGHFAPVSLWMMFV